MMIPIVKGRKANRLICILFGCISATFVIGAVLSAILNNVSLAYSLILPAIIFGGFSILYGIGWYVYRKKEARAQKFMEELIDPLLPSGEEEPVALQEFQLPREDLVKTAKTRFRKICSTALIVCPLFFIVFYAFLLFSIGYSGIRHLLSVLFFCILVSFPGIIIQYGIYKKYASSVPRRIILPPGKLCVDGVIYPSREIRHLTITSDLQANRNSNAIYRKLTVTTSSSVTSYTVDFKANSAELPKWERYPEFISALKIWSEQNLVHFTIDYMD